jgi:hypothetical protein
MIRRIALLCPDPSEPTFTTRIPAPVNAYRALFDSLVWSWCHIRGWTLRRPVWTACWPLSPGAITSGPRIGNSCWRGGDPALPLVDSPDVLAWNTRKTYLAQMGEAGVSVIPTRRRR